MPDSAERSGAIPRTVPEGTIPVISVGGSPYDCGCQYAQAVLEKYPGYRQYLDPACVWIDTLPRAVRTLYESKAPHILEIFRGMADTGGPLPDHPSHPDGYPDGGCTSFGVSGWATPALYP